MSAVMTPVQFSTPIESEILTDDELKSISGRAHKDAQIGWLRANGWKFATSAVGSPIVGRWYARMKLAGVELSDAVSPKVITPDFSKAR